MEYIVEIHNLGMKYHSMNGEINALENINLSVSKGEFISIVGPSGCGKSTLLSLVSGLLSPTEGEILLGGRKVNGTSCEVGYMLQKDHLFDWRTILQNVFLGLEVRNMLTHENREFVLDLLKTYGLYEFRDKYPCQLSGGMRQRAALIRTLAVKPEILILDEAFSALDYQTRLAVAVDIYSIIKKENKTAILVTHDISEGISMADRVVVLTKRPGTIKSIHDIEFTCPDRTPLSCREAPEFRIYFNKIWKELAANLKLIDSFITSQPSRVIRTLTNLYKEGQLFQHVGITCMETIVGFVLGTVAGTAIAMALAISLIVTILEVLNGFFAVDQEKIKLVQTFGANRIKILTKVVLPATVPTIINSLGQSDIGFAGPEASIYVYNEGKEDYSVVFAQLTKRDGQFLMGRKSEPDFKWSNLKGKYIIGGRKGGVPEMTLEYIIRKNGLTPGKDVNVDTAVQFNLMAGAFTGGQGDYVTLFEPTATMMEKEGKGYILASLGKESGEIPYTAYFAKKSYIEKNKDTIQKFTNAIYKGQLWVDSHTPEEIAKVIKPSFPDTEESLLAKVAKNYKDYDAWNKEPILKKESLDLLQKVMQEAGELKKTAEYDKLVNTEFAKEAIETVKK